MTFNRSPSDARTRRQMLRMAGTGFGMLGLSALLAEEKAARAATGQDRAANPLAVLRPHHAPRAKRCSFLYMPGGRSQLDLLDPKPRWTRDNGKPLPFEKPKLERSKTGNLLASAWKFRKHGQAGIEISELLPHLTSCVDDLCVLRSVVADNINHTGAALQMNTGEQAFSRPSLGSWLVYGLGSENQSLPGFVVISPAQPAQGAPLWSSSFLPAAYQGTLVSDLAKPIANLDNPRFSPAAQRKQ